MKQLLHGVGCAERMAHAFAQKSLSGDVATIYNAHHSQTNCEVLLEMWINKLHTNGKAFVVVSQSSPVIHQLRERVTKRIIKHDPTKMFYEGQEALEFCINL